MIPGEILTLDGDIELNSERKDADDRGREQRRPTDPGWLALPLLRNQQRAPV